MAERRTIRKVNGYVWCDKHGAIHDDATDPYGYGEGDEDCCTTTDHRSVLVRCSLDETF